MESLSMGDYGVYVWGSFGLTLAVIVIALVQSRLRHRKTENQIRQQVAARESNS